MLTQAYIIDNKLNGKLLGSDLWIEDNKEKFKIVNTTRIGLSKGGDLKLRYYIKDNKFVSRK